MTALALSTITIFVRSCFRVAELQQGFHGALANQQVTFMILEGAMVIISVVGLTCFHPGVAFQGSWGEADFTLLKRGSIGSIGNIEDTEGAKDMVRVSTRDVPHSR